MQKIFLYNTMSRSKEEFQPQIPGEVGLYTCGPTVYNYAHIGNLRAYLFEDFLKRSLEYNGYRVKHVMNITDVGHLVGDMDMGEDKVEVMAANQGKTAWEIAAHYTSAFQEDLKLLNIHEPDVWCRATDHIKEQIALIKALDAKGFVYRISDGLYFDTSLVKDYNKLSHLPLADLREGARVEKNPEKRQATDFALWKFSPAGAKRQMEWNSPWGVGFPGWHIECSAMSLKYLEKQLDIHCGGIDHINIHHTNEIAQSEAATGKPFFRLWMHSAFLNVAGGKKMAKSSDNFLTLKRALIDNDLDPLAFRLAALQVHYRKPMEYSAASFRQAQSAYDSLLHQVAGLAGEADGLVDSAYKEKFLAVINDDLNMPQALALMMSVLKSRLKPANRLATVLDFDRVLGLRLAAALESARQDLQLADLPSEVRELIVRRQEARLARDWETADRLRLEIEQAGYHLEDSRDDYTIRKAD